MLPKFLKAFEGPVQALNGGNKVLVVLQLSGGNDGLNTVIPVRNDIYYRERPGLSHFQEKNHFLLNDEAGLASVSYSFKSHYMMMVNVWLYLNNVGYPNPDRSHFRSMDIWQTASNSDEFLSSGWLGRYLDAECSGLFKTYSGAWKWMICSVLL